MRRTGAPLSGTVTASDVGFVYTGAATVLLETTFEFTRGEIRRAIWVIKRPLYLVALAEVVVAVLEFGIAAGDHGGDRSVFVAMGACLTLLAVLLVGIATLSVRIYRRRVVGSVTVSLGDTGYSLEAAAFSNTLHWPMFKKSKTTSEFWLLYVARSRAVFIPKRVVPAEQHAAVDDLLRRPGLISKG